MKRVKFFVHCPNEHIAKFSEEWHARAFAEMLSGRRPGWLIEMTHASGVVGQYRNGKPLPEFERHHIAGMFR